MSRSLLVSRFMSFGLAWLGLAASVQAELISLNVQRREPFADGKPFGEAGPYEKLVGVARFALDPANPRNRDIVDLALAPRNAYGKVEFEADFFILAPKDPARGNGAILYDVNNRGNKLALGFFNRGGGGNNPSTAEHAGDGYLFRRGYTVVWCGWIGELLSGNDRLLLRAPVATENGTPIRGLVRFEMVTDAPVETMPLSRREGHGSYPPTEQGERDAVLTCRSPYGRERVPIPRQQWSLERQPMPEVKQGVAGTLPHIRLRVSGGFRPGHVYELICECEGPIVQGVGFAAVRDLVAFLRYDESERNPFRREGRPALGRAHGFGVSQSGRFLRNFLHLGFNVDEKGRKVFDGLMPHVAGGGLGFFNHRFAQPTRNNNQLEEHEYPCDYFPFAYSEQIDPFTGKADGILKRTATEDRRLLPKVMHTQSAAEYWHRSGSLVHTNLKPLVDAEIPDEVRIYTFGGTQHGPASDPPGRGIGEHLNNPGDYRPFLKALLDGLDRWAKDGTPPPPSIYPRLDQGTLVSWRREQNPFPSIPGVRYPEVIHEPACLDFGLDFPARGIISNHPPKIHKGRYPVMVPKSGPDGNDLGTLLPPEVAVPLATFTGWNLRRRDVGAEGQLASLAGSYIPFPRTRAEREQTGDPRESVEERYGDFPAYRRRFAEACDGLVQRRLLLDEDARRLLEGRDKLRASFP